MRAWRAAHPHATPAEIEVEATRQVAVLRRDLVVAVLTPAKDAPVPPCPDCGQLMVRNGTATRTVTTRQGEPLTIQGTRMRCSTCGAELFPLAEALQLGSSHYSPWLVEGVVRLGCDLAFVPAAAVLTHFTGVTMSASTVRRMTLAAGETVGQPELARVTRSGPGPRSRARPLPCRRSSPATMAAWSTSGTRAGGRSRSWRSATGSRTGSRP